ncbi:hypothetical protein [Nonomuraea jabiensis]|uniref:hypothetical protein n=1 Tax=Nonomuraea jabiensis TaxID=882448 RepID=UPI003D71DEE2
MSVSFTVELYLPDFGDTAEVAMFQREGEWWITSKGSMPSEGAPCVWENTPWSVDTAVSAFAEVGKEVMDMLGVGFVVKSEVWEGV